MKIMVRCTHQTPEGVCRWGYSADIQGANLLLIASHAIENPGHIVAVTAVAISG